MYRRVVSVSVSFISIVSACVCSCRCSHSSTRSACHSMNVAQISTAAIGMGIHDGPAGRRC